MNKGRIGDIILAVLVVAITAMLLVPLPTPLIDVLIVVNLSVALLLLLVGLYMPNSLALLSFPTLLLLTTLFRLALNVASSRLILSQGDAGTVIHAFGTFLIQGEIVVGIIIFTIVTIVNFIVITKGSARVSEVSARFVLDALPGKQMTIDSDLRAGLITPEQAKLKRDDLRKESQLFGAMDGAMKFVQGDAIAGIFIIGTNIVGGLYQGVVSGMSFVDAVQTYTVLTIGDGLVSQIPALLISICAGIVVTRVSASENTTLGSDITTQLFARPGTVMASGALLTLLGFLPYIPLLPFAGVGSVLMISGFLLKRRQAASFDVMHADTTVGMLPPTQRYIGAPSEDVDDSSRIGIVLDPHVLHKLYRMNVGRYQHWWTELQKEFYQSTGMRLPSFFVDTSESLSSASYRVDFHDAVLNEGEVLLDNVLVELNPDHAPSMGVEVNSETRHPTTGARVFWSYQSPALRRITEAAQIRTLDFFECIGLRVAKYFSSHPEELFSTAEVYDQLKLLEKKHPGFISEALSRHFLSVPRFTDVCHELIRQGISVKDFAGIVESVSGYCAMHRITAADEADLSIQDLVEHVRIQKRRHIAGAVTTHRKTVKVYTMTPEVEQLFEDAHVDPRGEVLAMDPEHFALLRRGILGLLTPISDRGLLPVAVLCPSALRFKVGLFLDSCGAAVRALSVEELDSALKLERVGVWDFN